MNVDHALNFPSQVPVEMPHDDISRSGHFYMQSKLPSTPRVYPASPAYESDYHRARPPDDSTVVELPDRVQVEDTEAIRHCQVERPFSWGYDHDNGVFGHGNCREYQ